MKIKSCVARGESKDSLKSASKSSLSSSVSCSTEKVVFGAEEGFLDQTVKVLRDNVDEDVSSMTDSKKIVTVRARLANVCKSIAVIPHGK